MTGKIQRGQYGVKFRIKGPRGPITTEHWYLNRSDRDRAYDRIESQHKATGKLLWIKRIGK